VLPRTHWNLKNIYLRSYEVLNVFQYGAYLPKCIQNVSQSAPRATDLRFGEPHGGSSWRCWSPYLLMENHFLAEPSDDRWKITFSLSHLTSDEKIPRPSDARWKITFWLSHLTSDGKLAIWRQIRKYLGHLTSDGKLPFGWAIWRQMKNYLFAEPSNVRCEIT